MKTAEALAIRVHRRVNGLLPAILDRAFTVKL
jgi:hypothetical protein